MTVSEISNKTVFEVDGKEYAVTRPTQKLNEEASMEYNRVFSLSLKNGALLRESLEKYMRDQGLWDDEKEKTYSNILFEIGERERTLAKGGIKLSQARTAALEMKTLRATLQALISEKNALDVNTAQGQSENARFNQLLVYCLVYNDTGEQVFDNVDSYNDSAGEGSAAAIGAEKFANMYFGLDNDYEKNLPENKFLTKYKFTDTDGRFINQDGKFVDLNGKLVDENGRYISEDGKYIDIYGNPLDEEGEYTFETKPFLNDEGEPVDGDGEALSEKKAEPKGEPKKRRGRPKKKEEKTEVIVSSEEEST
jgi:hypothetical protein